MVRKRSKKRGGDVLVLVSGGIDSTACLEFYKRQGSSVCALFCDYGQLSSTQEIAAARNVCRHYGISLQVILCKGARKKKNGLIVGRNAFLLYQGLMEFKSSSGVIAIGVHGGTPYSDCSPEFVRAVQSCFDRYANGRVRIGAPFLDWFKKDIWNYCMYRQVPIDLTYSCELGRKQPCGRCPSCRDLKTLYALPKHDS